MTKVAGSSEPTHGGLSLVQYIGNYAGLLGLAVAACVCMTVCHEYGLLTYFEVRYSSVPLTVSDFTKNIAISLPVVVSISYSIYIASAVAMRLLIVFFKFIGSVKILSPLNWIADKLNGSNLDLKISLVLLVVAVCGQFFIDASSPILQKWISALSFLSFVGYIRMGTWLDNIAISDNLYRVIVMIVLGALASYTSGWIEGYRTSYPMPSQIFLDNEHKLTATILRQYENGVLIKINTFIIFIPQDRVKAINYGKVANLSDQPGKEIADVELGPN